MQPADFSVSELEASLEEQLLGLDPTGPRVVAIGGGHGLAAALQAVQAYASEITAIVTVADDGGSSGRLTAGLGVPPPGDIRRCLLALTPDPSIWSNCSRIGSNPQRTSMLLTCPHVTSMAIRSAT